jgi:thioredoxin-related protein
MPKIRIALVLVLSLYVSALFAQKPAAADQVLANAKTQAAKERKLIFLVFGASWCGPCHQLDAFLDDPAVRPVIEKYFVVAKLHFAERMGKHPELESPGAEELVAKLSGTDGKGQFNGVPFLVFLTATGEPIVNSNRPVAGHPGGSNIGYPSEPYEIDWFMVMLKKAVPQMTADESRSIEDWLRKASTK